MRRTRSSALAEAAAPPQRLRSLRSSSRNPPLSPPPVASLRRSLRSTAVRTPTVNLAPKLEEPIKYEQLQEQEQQDDAKLKAIEEKEQGQEENEDDEEEEVDAGLSPRVDGESKTFLGGITADMEEEEELEEDTILDDDDGVEYTLADDDITKAVQERIYSVAFLPRADRVVVACGDKMGHLIFPDSSKLVSSSFDGTVREFDLRAAESSVVYDTSDNAGISSLVAASTAQCYYGSCDDGTVRLIDRRARKAHASIYELHEKKINTVHQHPSLDFVFVGRSQDVEEEEHPLVTLPHHRSINCAYFSPRDGAWLVTVGQDSYIDMFDTSSLTERKASDKSAVTLPNSIRVRHNNITGRWLTKLHAAWDPKRPNQFVIGCMEHPRRIQIFRAGRRRPVRELKSDNFASVHSINAFHPHLELIAGGNSSGRLALWRGKKTDTADVKTEAKGNTRVKTK
ncbi:WD40 protein [Phytophthora cinnamomi]|uniref:WD40 protein n=1 Tax=Phytophthora cinnamomi TaxID=4785 RepID=UPI00355A2ECD|nr:WD40 protein [Phytophthora cinnamomi]